EKAEDVDYVSADVELRTSSKKQFVVYLQGSRWCGTGGCTTLILEPTKQSFKLLGVIPISRVPIRRLPTITNGCHDITVWVSGGGIDKPYQAKLRFDGKSYSRNPSLQP